MANGTDEELQLLLLLALRRRQKRRKGLRSVWVRSIFTLRTQQGEFSNLLQELRLSDPCREPLYEPPQRASPRPSFFPSVPPFLHHVARAWVIAILHSDWFNARLTERHDAGIEIKSIRASLRERPQHHSVRCSQYDAAMQRWFKGLAAGSSIVLGIVNQPLE